MPHIPLKEENPKGLHAKYLIRKIVGWKQEGFFGMKAITKAVDKNAEYFIMRLDEGGKDIEHIKACRIGVHSYANAIENHLPELAKDLRERYPLLDTPPVSATDAALMDVDKPDGVYAVNLSWGINYHPTDLSKVMKAKDCLFIGTGKECADFIYKNKPAPVSAMEDGLINACIQMITAFNDAPVSWLQTQDVIDAEIAIRTELHKLGTTLPPHQVSNR